MRHVDINRKYRMVAVFCAMHGGKDGTRVMIPYVQPITLRSRSGTTREVLAYLPNEECTSTLIERAKKGGMTVEVKSQLNNNIMKYKLYQIPFPEDGDEQAAAIYQRYAFSGLEDIDEVTLDHYRVAYEGDIEITGSTTAALEKLFMQLNANHPEDYHARSISVSDIVQIGNRYWFCDRFGWVVMDSLSGAPVSKQEVIKKLREIMATLQGYYFKGRMEGCRPHIEDLYEDGCIAIDLYTVDNDGELTPVCEGLKPVAVTNDDGTTTEGEVLCVDYYPEDEETVVFAVVTGYEDNGDMITLNYRPDQMPEQSLCNVVAWLLNEMESNTKTTEQ